MKFVCRTCEAFMTYTEQEKISDGSLGVTFTCPQCGHRFSMVTNAGETQMVYALGVKVGGRDTPAEPLEMTRQSLHSSPDSRPTTDDSRPSGGCPFPAILATDPAKKPVSEPPLPPLAWTTDAELRLERIPLFIRPLVQQEIERIARQRGVTLVTEDLLQEVREQMGPK